MRNKHIRNSKKGRFFSTLFNQRIIEGNDDLEQTIIFAANKNGLELNQALDLFREVKNRNWDGLVATKDGAISAWYKINAEALVKFTENLVKSKTK